MSSSTDPGNPQGTLLMTTVRTGNTEIFSFDLETGNASNLTRSPSSEERYPSWSPDGRQIAFTSDRDGTHNLYVMDEDGSNLRQLTHEHAPALTYFPSWTDDGQLIYCGYNPGKPKIARIRPNGSDFEVLAGGHDPHISPDGKTIAYVKRLERGYVVFAMDADGTHDRQLTEHQNEIGAVTPTWSPDGSTILFSDQVGAALEIFSVAKDGGDLRQMTWLNQIASCAAWSPDMQLITFRVTDEAFWRDPVRTREIYRDKPADKRPVWMMARDGSGPHVLELLHYQCAMDGSRAVWKPSEKFLTSSS